MNIQFTNKLDELRKSNLSQEAIESALLDDAVYRVNMAKDELEQAQAYMCSAFDYIKQK